MRNLEGFSIQFKLSPPNAHLLNQAFFALMTFGSEVEREGGDLEAH
jgi:hypothetical protein